MKSDPKIRNTEPLPPDHPSVQWEKAAIAAVSQAIKAAREGRDFADEPLFEALFGAETETTSDSGGSQDAPRRYATKEEPSNAMDH